MRYTLKFFGRRVGAIGVNSMYTAEREADNPKDAELALYDEFEHISGVRVLAADKGQYQGSCNREACQKPSATHYNRSTQQYYCDECARILNRANYDAIRYYGDGLLCVSVDHDAHPHHQA